MVQSVGSGGNTPKNLVTLSTQGDKILAPIIQHYDALKSMDRHHSLGIPLIHDKTTQGPDWSQKLQTLTRAYEIFRKDFNELTETPPGLLRAAEGLYPDYGQYENVPNSGWSYYTPRSLSQQNALSIPDKIAYGVPIGTLKPAIDIASEDKAIQLSKLFNKEGGLNSSNHEKYTQNFNKTLLSQLENYVDMEGMGNKTDDISRLTHTQLKSWFDNLRIILDDDELKKFTGISNDIIDEKEAFIKNRLLPDPMEEALKGKGATLWSEDENKIAQELTHASRFKYLKKYLLDSPTTMIDDDNSLYNQSPKTFLNPYEGVSDTAKAMLNVRRNHIEQYSQTLPHDKAKKIQEIFYKPEFLARYKGSDTAHLNTNMQGVLPDTYTPISSDFFKMQQQLLPSPHNDFRQKAHMMLGDMNVSDQFYQRRDLGFY